MYSIVDKKSDLYWSARNDIELIMDPQKRTRKSTDASVKEESGRWQKDFQGSVGYGEITKGAFTNYLTICQNISSYIKSACVAEGMDVNSLPF